MEAPLPTNEFERLIDLSELSLDYSDLQNQLGDLTKLAARIVGTEVSLINLIDNYTQWSVAREGMDLQQMPREESVCQYTILEADSFEVEDLSEDQRFKEKDYVKEDPHLRYYFGVPLTTSQGTNIGSLCVLDTETGELSSEQKEQLSLVANQIVWRLESLKRIKELQEKVDKLNRTKRKVIHDIRSPVFGIVGLADIIKEEIENENYEELLELIDTIKKGGNSVMEYAESVMSEDSSDEKTLPDNYKFSCDMLCQKLNQLYRAQARSKGVSLSIDTNENNDDVFFSKRRLLQIAGNLISNSIKYTHKGGSVDVRVGVSESNKSYEPDELTIIVEDTGVGMNKEQINKILEGYSGTQPGTGGEKGYGFGLSVVRHLVHEANGQMDINSEPGEGTKFTITLPV